MDQSLFQQQNNPSSQEEGIDIREIIFLLVRNWYWFAIGLSIALAGAWFYLRYTIPVYNVKSTLLVQDQTTKSSLSEEAVVEELGFRSVPNISNELQILKSRSLMRKVVDSLGIHITYHAEGRIKTSEIYHPNQVIRLKEVTPEVKAYGKSLKIIPLNSSSFNLVKEEGDSTLHSFGIPFEQGGISYTIDYINQPNDDNAPLIIKIRQPQQVASYYANALSLRPIGSSSIIALNIEDPVPDKAIDVINTLIHIYNRSILEDKRSSGEKTLTFINDRLRSINADLNIVEGRLEGFKQRQDIPLDISQSATNFLDQISTQDELLIDIQLRQQLLTDIRSFLQVDSNRLKPLPVTSEILGGSLATLVTEYNTLLLEREKVLIAGSATQNNPAAQLNLGQIENFRKNIILGVDQMEREFRTRETRIKERLDPILQKIETIPSTERQLLQIMREQKITETLYLYLLQKREETELSLVAEVANSRLVDYPTLAGRVSPDKNRTYLIAIFLGLLLPGGIVLLRERLDNKVYSEKDIRSLTAAPFLGMIGQPRKEEKLVIRKGSRSAVAESFRLLRTNLQFILNEEKQQRILVTSCVSGEGKTFVCVNLGASLALSGKKTIILGLDLRKPKLAQYFTGEKADIGLTNYIVGDAPLSAIIKPTSQGNLFFIGCGPIPPNPAELLMGAKMEALIEELKATFDAIVIDTSPVGLVTDALLLSQFVNASLFVTRFAKTHRAALNLLEDIYQKKKLPKPGVILNGVKGRRGYGYGNGYGYGYGYGNGYGYYEEDKTR